MRRLLMRPVDHTVSTCAFSSSLLANLFATIVRSSPTIVRALMAATIVNAIPNSPKSSGARIRARTRERRKRRASPMSDDETFQLRPSRTLFPSVKFSASVRPVMISAAAASVRRNGVISFEWHRLQPVSLHQEAPTKVRVTFPMAKQWAR